MSANEAGAERQLLKPAFPPANVRERVESGKAAFRAEPWNAAPQVCLLSSIVAPSNPLQRIFHSPCSQLGGASGV